MQQMTYGPQADVDRSLGQITHYHCRSIRRRSGSHLSLPGLEQRSDLLEEEHRGQKKIQQSRERRDSGALTSGCAVLLLEQMKPIGRNALGICLTAASLILCAAAASGARGG